MIPLLETYWPLLVAALAIGILVAWFMLRANRKTRVSVDKRDVLDEGAAPAARNQALIDSDSPAVTTPAPTATTAPSDGDDLTQIKGLGSKIAEILNGIGVTSYAQIASWDDAKIAEVDSQLGRFEGRIRRDNWVEQARLLAEGDKAEFDSRFGNS